DAVAKAKAGSDVYACLFRAHLLVWQYAKAFEHNEAAAAAYMARPDVRAELGRAFGTWTAEPYRPRRASVAKLPCAAFWFFRTGDKPRLKKAMKGINNVVWPAPWSFEEGGTLLYTQAMQEALAG